MSSPCFYLNGKQSCCVTGFSSISPLSLSTHLPDLLLSCSPVTPTLLSQCLVSSLFLSGCIWPHRHQLWSVGRFFFNPQKQLCLGVSACLTDQNIIILGHTCASTCTLTSFTIILSQLSLLWEISNEQMHKYDRDHAHV